MFFNKSSIDAISISLKEKALKEGKSRTFLTALFRMKDYTAEREEGG